MTERGSSLVELLIAALIGSLVVFAAGSVYVSAVRSGRDDDSLTYLQRQGSLILDEVGRQVRPADTLQGPPGQLMACGGVAGSILANVPDPAGVIQPWCFRLDAAGGTQLIEDRPAALGWTHGAAILAPQ